MSHSSSVKLILLLSLFIFKAGNISPAAAWDGIDSETGESVEIGSGNVVRYGQDIEIYDYSTGNYHDVEVQNIERGYGSVEVEVYDYETNEYRTLEMDE